MARIVKEHLERRTEILDTAQRLIISKGYERMTIQDLLDELQISKGAFYHYYDSKQELLQALIDRMQEEAKKVVLPILEDAQEPALTKLHHIFDTSYRWKTARKEFLLGLLQAWYSDDNVIVRQKQTTAMLQWVTPLLQTIIEQGITEGVFHNQRTAMLGHVVISLIVAQGEMFAEQLLSSEVNDESMERVGQTVAAYTDAIERVLGVAPGSLKIVDVDALKREWAFS